MIDQQAIENITAAFVPEYASFVKGDFAKTTAEQFAKKQGFSPAQQEALHDGITLYLLTVFSAEELIAYIESTFDLPEEEARLLVYILHVTLPQNFTELHSETRSALAGLALSQSATKTTTQPTTNIPPASGIPPIRTMPSDMQKQTADIPTYTSTQEAILREGYSTPKTDVPPAPSTIPTPPATPATPPPPTPTPIPPPIPRP